MTTSSTPGTPGTPGTPDAATTTAPDAGAAFAGPHGHADVVALIVTYDSAHDVELLLHSLRADVGGLAVRVVVVDNDSRDGTAERVAAHCDVRLHRAGANLGYAAAINLGRRIAGDADTVLVLNPDVVIRPGMTAALRSALLDRGAAAAVPQILNPDGTTYDSLRREPSLARALGDALRLHRLPGLHRMSEQVRDHAGYARPHAVDWATGAVLMIATGCADIVGDWDERFFLYSEETDYARRIRDAGGVVGYVPDAIAEHRAGGSGGPAELASLMAVNRIRYVDKHHGRPTAALFRLVVLLHHLVRAGRSPAHRHALRTVARRASWAGLPRGGTA